MTDDKHMNPDDQPLTDSPAEHTAGEQDLAPDAVAAEEGASQGASRAETELADLKDKYLRLAAEFENYKRRTAKERSDLFKTANQELMVALLPVLDDFDRFSTVKSADDESYLEALKDFIGILQSRLRRTLEQKGLSLMETSEVPFDSELHEAIAQVPSPPNLAGKVVDTAEKGYYLGDKVIRHAKVILGQ